ncbi:MAG: helix-turn-helix domain-containing protein [Beijerinckiaceae bacterium]|nr:helix-turn-helix domain-containing protein [Beijerinckiaceae bacterium]
MGLKQTVARNVRTLRLARGYSQEELSALAGINRNYTGMIERQQRSPTIDTIEKLAKALKVDADALLSTDRAKAQTASLDDHGA